MNHQFDFSQYFDDAEELIAGQEGPTLVEPPLARRIRSATPPLVTREHTVLRRFRAGD